MTDWLFLRARIKWPYWRGGVKVGFYNGWEGKHCFCNASNCIKQPDSYNAEAQFLKRVSNETWWSLPWSHNQVYRWDVFVFTKNVHLVTVYYTTSTLLCSPKPYGLQLGTVKTVVTESASRTESKGRIKWANLCLIPNVVWFRHIEKSV